MTDQQKRALITSVLVSIVVACGLLRLCSSFGWPVAHVIIGGIGSAVMAGAAVYVTSLRKKSCALNHDAGRCEY